MAYELRISDWSSDVCSSDLLSSGLADLVVEADLKPYDYLAQAPIIAGAGGVMTDWEGRPPGLESDGRVLCAGDRRCHALATSLLQGTCLALRFRQRLGTEERRVGKEWMSTCRSRGSP